MENSISSLNSSSAWLPGGGRSILKPSTNYDLHQKKVSSIRLFNGKKIKVKFDLGAKTNDQVGESR